MMYFDSQIDEEMDTAFNRLQNKIDEIILKQDKTKIITEKIANEFGISKYSEENKIDS